MAAAASFGRIDRFFDRIGAIETPFSIEMPNGNKREVGEGEPQFEGHEALFLLRPRLPASKTDR